MRTASRTPLRACLAVIVVAAALPALVACSLFAGVPRDSDTGQVTETLEIKSSQLLTGDCFSYIGDASDLTSVTVTPCTTEHTHVVIGQGTLTDAVVSEAGGLQNAVSSQCAADFETFTASLAEGESSKQEFLVNTRDVDGEKVKTYSCVALDPEGAASEASGDDDATDDAADDVADDETTG